MPIEKGDILLIPSPGTEARTSNTIEWSQTLTRQTAGYIALVVQSRPTRNPPPLFGRAGVLIFIAAEWFTDAYLGGVAHKTASGEYELTIDDKFQYAQRRRSADEHPGTERIVVFERFVVFHDKARKMHHHQFLQTLLTRDIDWVGTEAANPSVLGYDTVEQARANFSSDFTGDYLQTF
ncbi:hypothetical protein FA95DRAFT_1574161 [Auriscalpium vulgare]|uniref:Uncharacterized protein n=1 Tax=Auriscalpium vulgare TaxID=40419 RepID=A0ACB8RL12_9AGAM|nr:hypothetical protein FA95DRAFT_1574161 [Auriscalpium vulgare]